MSALKKSHGLSMASKTASVSYRAEPLDKDLLHSLAFGDLLESIYPQVAALLDEARLGIILPAVEDAAEINHVSPKIIWKNRHRWTQEMR